MKIKQTTFRIIALFAIIILAGCASQPREVPPQPGPAEKLTAKEAWDRIGPAKETLSVSGVPVYIMGESSYKLPVEEGKASVWWTGFYSENERAVWVVHYFAWYTDTFKGEPELFKDKSYSDVTLTAYDLTDWNIDSPEACRIAAQNGAGETDFMRLQVAGLEALNKDSVFFSTPEFIPESCKLFWVIRDTNNNESYIDACTGEYLGSCAV